MRARAQQAAGAITSNKMRTVWYLWLVVLCLVVAFFASAIAAAVSSVSGTFNFVVIWNALVLIFFSIWGTLVLRRLHWRTPTAVGGLIGASCMLITIMLESAALSGASFATFGLKQTPSASDANTAFAALLIVFLFFFTVFCYFFRKTLMPVENSGSGAHGGMPSAQFSGSGDYAPKYDESSMAANTYGAVAPPQSL